MYLLNFNVETERRMFVSPNVWEWRCTLLCVHTAQQFEFMYSQKRIARPRSQFPRSCVCERSIYSHVRPIYFPAAEKAARPEKNINRSQNHECRNWDCSRAVPFLVRFFSNFRYCVFAVHLKQRRHVFYLSSILFGVYTLSRIHR